MMSCREVADRLSPFLDDELDPATSRDIERHVSTCADCAAELARLRAVQQRLRGGLEYRRAPDLLRERVTRGVRADAAAPARRARSPWLAVAAVLAVVAGGAWMLAPLRGGEALARDAVSSHIRSLMASHLADVASTDQHTVKPWFAGRLDYSPPVTDFAAAGYPLTGGRLDYLDGHPVAALVYMHRKHVINAFVWPAAGGRELLAPASTERGYHVVHAAHAGMTWWIVSDLNVEELGAFARMLTTDAAPR
jgi:anti-sigma factor RsiW